MKTYKRRSENELKEALAALICIVNNETDPELKRQAVMTQTVLMWVLGDDNSFGTFFKECSAAIPEELRKQIHAA